MANQWAEQQLIPLAHLWELQGLTNILWPIEISRKIDKKLAKSKTDTTESLLIWLSDTGDVSLTNKELKQYLLKLFETISNKYIEFYNQKDRTSYSALSLAIVSSEKLIDCIRETNLRDNEDSIIVFNSKDQNYTPRVNQFKKSFEIKVAQKFLPFSNDQYYIEEFKSVAQTVFPFAFYPSLDFLHIYREDIQKALQKAFPNQNTNDEFFDEKDWKDLMWQYIIYPAY